MSSISLYTFNIVITVLLYIFYTDTSKSECNLNIFFITFNLILTILVSLVSISNKVQEANSKSGLLQSAFLTAYTTYLVASAAVLLINAFKIDDPTKQCSFNPASNVSSPSCELSVFIMYVGIILTIFSLAYSAMTTGTSDSFPQISDTDATGEYNFSLFHFSFVMASFYTASVITKWGVPVDAAEYYIMTYNYAGVWVKVGTSWICVLLYLWVLLAPLILTGRDFS